VADDVEQEFEFDVALSFAGEDRAYVNAIAHTGICSMRQGGCVFGRRTGRRDT